MDSVIAISQMKDVIVLHPAAAGYGFMLQINGDWGQIAKFKKLCREINERMRFDPNAPFTMLDKKSNSESLTIEFVGGRDEKEVLKASIAISKEMKLPLTII
ncbi:hypothetical protein D3C81_587420 [compost metagenome]